LNDNPRDNQGGPMDIDDINDEFGESEALTAEEYEQVIASSVAFARDGTDETDDDAETARSAILAISGRLREPATLVDKEADEYDSHHLFFVLSGAAAEYRRRL
jgi:hypothetical protein